MSFYGRKYRRVKCQNMKEFYRILGGKHSEQVLKQFMGPGPVFWFDKLSENTFSYRIEFEGKNLLSLQFRLGEEFSWERNDGEKLRITFYQDEDNLLRQRIMAPDGKITYFMRELHEDRAKMTMYSDSLSNVKGRIYYERVYTSKEKTKHNESLKIPWRNILEDKDSLDERNT